LSELWADNGIVEGKKEAVDWLQDMSEAQRKRDYVCLLKVGAGGGVGRVVLFRANRNTRTEERLINVIRSDSSK
jgi:hypothetical protein